MKRMITLALACAGCVSDLAVGMSVSPVDDRDGGASSELDASEPPVRDAGDLDTGLRPPDASRDASASLDASRDAGRDASYDAGYDAGPAWRVCMYSECITQFTAADKCKDGGAMVCARPYPDEGCEITCL